MSAVSLKPNAEQLAYAKEVLRLFMERVPEAGEDDIKRVLARSIRTCRSCDVIAHFRRVNYGIEIDPLNAEFVG